MGIDRSETVTTRSSSHRGSRHPRTSASAPRRVHTHASAAAEFGHGRTVRRSHAGVCPVSHRLAVGVHTTRAEPQELDRLARERRDDCQQEHHSPSQAPNITVASMVRRVGTGRDQRLEPNMVASAASPPVLDSAPPGDHGISFRPRPAALLRPIDYRSWSAGGITWLPLAKYTFLVSIGTLVFADLRSCAAPSRYPVSGPGAFFPAYRPAVRRRRGRHVSEPT